MIQVPLHTRFETAFESAFVYDNPVQDVGVTVEFSNDAEVSRVDAFWDGERCWRVRFSPPQVGSWSWRSHCSRQEDTGLHDQQGEFECLAAAALSEWLLNGPLQVSTDCRHLEFANGTPFFWLADTAWNGPLKAALSDWDVYLADRVMKGFSVIQFVATHWLGAAADAEGRPAYTNPQRIRIEPAFFQRMDRRIARINDFGLVAAPVLAWAATWSKDSIHLNPGTSLTDDQIIVLIRYLVSRYGAHQVVWILAGDGIYRGAEAERWRRIGRAALAGSPRLATVHPSVRLWVDKEFEGEPWYSFNGYQSGQFNNEDNARWINARLRRDCSELESQSRTMPTIDLEPCYEDHLPLDAPGAKRMDAFSVRRALYWSLLAAPVAGVSYGAHGVWSWEGFPAVPLSHPHSGTARTWREAIELPGSESIRYLRAMFNSIEWWRLNPSLEMLEARPGFNAPLEFIAAACSQERDLGVIYDPVGGMVSLRPGFFDPDCETKCLDPATGLVLWTQRLGDCYGSIDCGEGGDRLLLIKAPEERKSR